MAVDIWDAAPRGEQAVRGEVVKWIVASIVTGVAFATSYEWTQSAWVAALASVYAVIFGGKIGYLVNKWRIRRIAIRARGQVQVQDGTTATDNGLPSRPVVRRDSVAE